MNPEAATHFRNFVLFSIEIFGDWLYLCYLCITKKRYPILRVVKNNNV